MRISNLSQKKISDFKLESEMSASFECFPLSYTPMSYVQNRNGNDLWRRNFTNIFK